MRGPHPHRLNWRTKENNSLQLQTGAARLTSLLHDWRQWGSHPDASCHARDCHLPQPSSAAVAHAGQETSTIKQMQPPQQIHPVLTIAIHMEVSSQQLTVYQETRPQVSAQLDDQRTSKVGLRSTNPFRITSAACPSKSAARTIDRRCCIISILRFQLFSRRLQAPQSLSDFLSMKSMQQLTLLFVLDTSSTERSFVDDFLILSILPKLINLQHIVSQSEAFENTKSHCADRDVSLHLPKAMSTFRCPWCRFWASVASHRNVSS